MSGQPIGRVFFRRPSQEVAPALLGCRLVHETASGTRVSGTIVETEAYLGVRDRAAHSFGGRRTERTESMYHQAGTSYVYFTYGMHHCFNVVCGHIDEPVAVLIRAIEPEEGTGLMRRRREASNPGRKHPIRDRELASGPGRLCQALGLSRSEDGLDLCAGRRLYIEKGRGIGRQGIASGPRIGIGDCGIWTNRKLRWWVSKNTHVSR